MIAYLVLVFKPANTSSLILEPLLSRSRLLVFPLRSSVYAYVQAQKKIGS